MTDTATLAFEKVEQALKALEVALRAPMQPDRLSIDAAIQRFEFSIELFWKLLKRILADQGVEVAYPKQTLKEAYAGRLINNEDIWINMLNDRNITSHTYDMELADQIFSRLKDYYPVMQLTLLALKKQSKV